MLHLVAQYSTSGSNQTVQTGAALAGALVIGLFALAMIALVLFIWGTIFKKAGYSFWMSLLMLVPLVNLIWLLIFAFSKWPIQQELESLRGGGGYGGYAGGGFPVPPVPPR